MRVLLDENLPHKLRTSLVGHEVMTASYMGWNGIANGRLLSIAERNGIDVLVTGDNNIAYQQSMAGRTISVVTLSATKWMILQSKLPEIQDAIENAKPGSFHFVDCGDPGE
jgi:predicted nuclease of predicted toxin-antitoxin system